MQSNDISTTSTKHQKVTPPGQGKEQERASGTSSSPPSLFTTFVGQEVLNNASNGTSQKKPSERASEPASAPSSSSTATVLEASISSGAADSDPRSIRSGPGPATIVDTSLSPSLPGTSPVPSPKSWPSTTPALKAVRCEYPGCSRPAKYREERDAPPSACQSHKRKGQYTINRKKELLIATRDGDAFRTPEFEVTAATAAGFPPPTSDAKGTAAASDSLRLSMESGGGGVGGVSSSACSRPKQAVKHRTPPPKHLLQGSNQHGPFHGHEPNRESQDRPCLFPGCVARPGYGLPGAARAVYCLSHKKSSMVHIFQKQLDARNHGQKRRIAATSAAAESKTTNNGKQSAKKDVALAQTTNTNTKSNSEKKGMDKAWRKPNVDEEVEDEDGGGGGIDRGMITSRLEEGKMNGDVKPQLSVHHKTELSASPVTSEVERVAGGGHASTTATANSSSQGTATTNALLPPPSINRMAETSGMTPSVEMLRLRQARETAKKEARARGRRPRAPSRRVLEASGRMQGEGAQWLTREKRAEQARVTAELREQRRLYKEAGLQFGVVLEVLVEPAAVVSGEGENAGEGGLGGVEPARSDPSWQKISPALLTTVQQQQLITRSEGERPEKRARPNSMVDNA